MDSIKDCLDNSDYEVSSPEFAHFSPEDYFTKPKKPINNILPSKKLLEEEKSES